MSRLIWPRMIECPACDGTGGIEIFDSPLDIEPMYTEPCPECDGTGEIKVDRVRSTTEDV